MPFSEQRSALHCGVKACVPLKIHLQRGCTSALILGGRVDNCQPGDTQAWEGCELLGLLGVGLASGPGTFGH